MLSMSNAISNVSTYNTKGKDEARTTAIKSRGIPGLLHIEGHKAPSNFKKLKNRDEKDFLSSNVRRMRQIQRENRHREHARTPETPTKDLWKCAKFRDIQSRFKSGQDEGINGYPVRPSSSHEFLRGHSRPNTATGQRPSTAVGGQRPNTASSVLARQCMSDTSIQQGVQRLCLDEELLEKHEIDYIKLNGKLAKHSIVQRSASVMALDDLRKSRQSKYSNYKKGVVPKYLKERQDGWEKDELDRIRNEPDPDLPEGHRKLPEKERIETLEKLQQNERDVLQKMQMLPICGQTFRVKQQNLVFNQQLAEIAEAIKIFSRVKVFVKLEETPRP